MNVKAASARRILTKMLKTKRRILPQPIGIPTLINVQDLKAICPRWLEITQKIRADKDLLKDAGWVAEMWGYVISAAELSIEHEMVGLGSFPNDRVDKALPLIHYCYASEVPGIPWRWDKRGYKPWRAVMEPPPEAPAPIHTLVSIIDALCKERGYDVHT